MASDIYSMLTGGYDPYAESMKQEQAFQQRLSSATDPRSFIAAVGSNLGGQLGRGASRLFGGASPEEEKTKLKQEALAEVQASGIDMSDQVAVLKGIMQALQKRGLTAEAMAVGASMPKPEKVATTTLAKLLAEQKNYKEGTPGYAAYQKAIDKEVSAAGGKEASLGVKAEVKAYKLYKKPFASLTTEEKAEVARLVEEDEKSSKSLGQGLADFGESLAKSLGKDVGADVAESISPKVLQGKEDTLGALNRARDLLDKGIYTGGLASAQMAISKYSPLGSREKLENTEKYIAYVSTTVIPLLKEFGGNDSNEELKFLQRLVGGEITLEEGTLKEIIDSAIIKVTRSIERTQQNVKDVAKGQLTKPEVTPQAFGAQAAPIGVGETTTVNGVTVKRVR